MRTKPSKGKVDGRWRLVLLSSGLAAARAYEADKNGHQTHGEHLAPQHPILTAFTSRDENNISGPWGIHGTRVAADDDLQQTDQLTSLADLASILCFPTTNDTLLKLRTDPFKGKQDDLAKPKPCVYCGHQPLACVV
jgi:hypothetical protein